MGNNGGDGLVMARHLSGYDAKVTVSLLGTPEMIKTEESTWNWSILQKMPSVNLHSNSTYLILTFNLTLLLTVFSVRVLQVIYANLMHLQLITSIK